LSCEISAYICVAMYTIGTKINWLLSVRNISREKFAEELGWGDRTVQKILTNEKKLDLLELERVALYFGIKPIELEYGEPKIVFDNKDQVTVTNQGTIHTNAQGDTLRILEKEIDLLLKLCDNLRIQNEVLVKENQTLRSDLNNNTAAS
jgi:transcriptional regulator with XRE-family HTH domain